jgi:hypothetical protein
VRTTTLFMGALLASTLPLAAARAGILARTREWRPSCNLSSNKGCLDGQADDDGFSFSAPVPGTRDAGNAARFVDSGPGGDFHATQGKEFTDVPDPGTAGSAGHPDYAGFSPGESTAFGRHTVEWTLLTAPLAAFALSPALDRRLHYQDNGIWQRNRQLDFEYAVILGEVGGSLWFGGQSRIGKTFWRSMDASFYTAITVQAMKYAFSRARPRQSASPDHWFQGNCCQSFPSGEVSFQASAVTPFIAEYHKQYPWVWALEALPAYDALARMKTHGHWQTDVLAAWAIGTAWGLYAHYEPKPLILSIMPHGILVGIHVKF